LKNQNQIIRSEVAMSKSVLALGAVLLFSISGFAQEYPKAELFMGYEYIYFSPALAGNPTVGMHGGGGSIGFNMNRMFGLKAEFTGAGFGNTRVCSSNGINCLTRSANMFTYMFGPQLTFRGNPRVQPFTHVLVGGAFSNTYANLKQIGTITTIPAVGEGAKHAFTLAAGAGVDLKVHSRFAIRLGQLDYLMTRFSGREINLQGSGSVGALQISNQSSFRYLVGINIYLGSKD
jgi:opacity protein-like surface antigen